MWKQSCVYWPLLLCMAIVGAGCGMVQSLPGKPLVDRVLFDTSSGSGVSPASGTSLVDGLLPEVVRRRGSMEFFRLDDVEGAVFINRFVTGSPARESRSAIAAFERDRLIEGKRSFLQARDALVSGHPRTSPLALALTVMSMNHPQNAEVRYYLVSDGREWSPSLGVDMECYPPTMERWAATLQAAGLLPHGSLQGATVTFVGVRPMMSVPGNRCVASLSLMNRTRQLWEGAIANAGGRVVFARDQDDLPNAAVLVFFGTGVLAWRKSRVKARAKRDRKEVRYAFGAILMELLGPKPGLDPDHPEHQEALRRIGHLRLLVDELSARLRALREELAGHVRWEYLTGGTTISAVTEGIAWTLIYRDAGMPSPERYLVGGMSGLFFLVLVMFAVKHAEKTGQRTWFFLSIAVILLIAAAATTVRVKNAMVNGADLWEELAFGVLVSCAALGPALVMEYIMRPLRLVLPIVRLRREIKKQLREAERELKKVTKRLAQEAELRRAWEWEAAVLKGVYDGYNPPTPTGPNPPTGPNDPLHGGVQWPHSAS